MKSFALRIGSCLSDIQCAQFSLFYLYLSTLPEGGKVAPTLLKSPSESRSDIYFKRCSVSHVTRYLLLVRTAICRGTLNICLKGQQSLKSNMSLIKHRAGNYTCMWLRECFRHVKAEVVGYSRNTLHQTTYCTSIISGTRHIISILPLLWPEILSRRTLIW